MHEIQTSNWRAWIDKKPIQPTPAGTLHVVCDIISEIIYPVQLLKMESQGINPQILLLEIRKGGGTSTVESHSLHYKEELSNENIYSSVEVYNHGKKIISINDIEEAH